MITARKLYEELSVLIPSELSEEWDNDGLMCMPDGEREIKKVLIALDITDKTLEYAEINGFDAIISHHPLIFKPIKAVNDQNNVAEKVIRLIKAGIAAMSFHTRFDSLDGGVNSLICSVLGLENVTKEGICRAGELKEAIPFDLFAQKVKKTLGSPFIACIDGSCDVKRVTVLGGDGKDDAFDFMASDSDTYVTGSLSYNIMCDLAESGKNVIAAGHFYTENPSCAMLSELVKGISADIETEIYNSNPIKYI